MAALFLAVVAAGTVAMGTVYPGTDGGGWMGSRVAQLAPFQSLFLLLGGMAALAGAASSLLGGGRRPVMFISGGVAAAGALILAFLGGLSAKLIPWLDAPDWLRITLLIVAGACWGLGWGCARSWTRIEPPLWSFLAPFFVGGVATSVLSGSPGGILTLVWLLMVATALGTACWNHLPFCRPGPSQAPNQVVAFAVGVALLGLLARTLGLLHFCYPAVLLVVLVALALLLRRTISAIASTTARRICSTVRLPPADAILAGALGAILLAQWIASIGPEVGGDSTGARVALPAIWLHEGVISAHREIILSYMGIGGESFFLLLLPLAGNSVAKIVAFACLLVIINAMVGRIHRWANAWVVAAVVAFAASTIVWWQLMWGFCDLLQTLLMLGSVEALRRWWQREDDRYLFAAGLLAGASTAVKLNSVLLVGAVVAVPVVVNLLRRRGFGSAIAAALRGGVPATLMLAPALVRSAYLTGNPVFPFANTLFKSPLAPDTLVTIHFGLPLRLAVWQDIFKVFLEPQKFVEVGTYHPFLLPLLVGCGAVFCAVTREARFWLGAFFVSGAFWLITEQNLRYSLFVGLFAALAVARTAAALRRARGPMDWPVPSVAMALVVIAGVMLQLARPSFWMAGGVDYQALPLRWAIGQETTDAFLRRNQQTYPLAQVLNQAAGTRARVWQMPWIRDHLYFEGQVVSMPHGDLRMLAPLITLLPGHGPADLLPSQIAGTLRTAGITHLIMDVNNPWVGNTPESTWTAVFSPAFTESWLEPMAADRGLRLYRLRKTPRTGGRPAQMLVRIPLANGNTELPVDADRLYDLFLPEMPATTARDDYADCEWLDGAGKLILFQRLTLPTATPGGWHHWMQTAPPGAHRLIVHVNGTHPGSAIELRALPPDRGDR